MCKEDKDKNYCKYHEWDDSSFVLPKEYCLDESSDLADALNVFYQAGGYYFFNVVNPEYYASNWLEFIGSLYSAIMEDKYISDGKQFAVPLDDEQKQELLSRNVPERFIKDIR